MASRRDEIEHLNLLSVFHWVLGGCGVVFSLFPLLHVVVGMLIVNGTFPAPPPLPNAQPLPNNQPMPDEFGWLFIVIGLTLVFIGQTISWLTVYSGFQIHQQRRRLFSLIIAGGLCLFVPLGTVLGILTIIALQRPSVQKLYDAEVTANDELAYFE